MSRKIDPSSMDQSVWNAPRLSLPATLATKPSPMPAGCSVYGHGYYL
jgi:hypothetical protein